MQSSPILTRDINTFIADVQTNIQNLLPDAVCEVEQFGSSIWLNVAAGHAFWTVENDLSRGEAGLTCVPNGGFTAGHDVVFSVQDPAIPRLIAAQIRDAQQKQVTQQNGRSIMPRSTSERAKQTVS